MHRPYTRIVKNAETAVLFIHGIVSTPQVFDPLLPQVPADCSLMCLLLAGHGGTARDFAHGSMALWQLQVDSAVTYLAARHRRLVVAGHSMGALLALDAALRRPACVSSLLLLDAPLRIRVTPLAVVNSLHLALGLPFPDNPAFLAARAGFGVTPSRDPLTYLTWLPRYAELFRLSRRLRPRLSSLQVTCVALQSGRDEMVSPAAAALLRACPRCRVSVLPDATHFRYGPGGDAQIAAALRGLLTHEESA